MNFDELITVADWTSALQQIVSLADAAFKSRDQDEIDKVQDLLFKFQEQSPPSVNNLDTIAFKVSKELAKENKEQVLKNLNDLSKELVTLSKFLDVATEHALLKSDAIQLKNTKDFLSKAKASLEILKGLREDLQDPTTNLGKKVEEVFKAINEFEKAF
ncbi:hypothetical protein GCM10028807_36260 [Spirosoma daeguense]